MNLQSNKYKLHFIIISIIFFLCSCNSSNSDKDMKNKRKEDAIKAYEYLPKSLKRELSRFVKSNDSLDLVYKKKGIFFENYNVYRIDFFNKNNDKMIIINRLAFYSRLDTALNYLGYVLYNDKMIPFYTKQCKQDFIDEGKLIKTFPSTFPDELSLEYLNHGDCFFVRYKIISKDSLVEINRNLY